jgi:hypothetical protein
MNKRDGQEIRLGLKNSKIILVKKTEKILARY